MHGVRRPDAADGDSGALESQAKVHVLARGKAVRLIEAADAQIIVATQREVGGRQECATHAMNARILGL